MHHVGGRTSLQPVLSAEEWIPRRQLRKLLLNYANLRSLHGLPIPLFCTHCHCPSLTLRHTETPDPIPATGRDFNEFVSPSHPPISLPSCVGLCF